MSYVEEIARDALKTAHTDLFRARRNLMLVAGVLGATASPDRLSLPRSFTGNRPASKHRWPRMIAF